MDEASSNVSEPGEGRSTTDPTPPRALTRAERREINAAKHAAHREQIMRASLAITTHGVAPSVGPAPPMPDPATPEGRAEFARAGFAWGWRVLHGEIPGTTMDRIAIVREFRMSAGWGKETPKTKDVQLPLGSILRPIKAPEDDAADEQGEERADG